jgi:hypothetical protein
MARHTRRILGSMSRSGTVWQMARGPARRGRLKVHEVRNLPAGAVRSYSVGSEDYENEIACFCVVRRELFIRRRTGRCWDRNGGPAAARSCPRQAGSPGPASRLDSRLLGTRRRPLPLACGLLGAATAPRRALGGAPLPPAPLLSRVLAVRARSGVGCGM